MNLCMRNYLNNKFRFDTHICEIFNWSDSKNNYHWVPTTLHCTLGFILSFSKPYIYPIRGSARVLKFWMQSSYAQKEHWTNNRFVTPSSPLYYVESLNSIELFCFYESSSRKHKVCEQHYFMCFLFLKSDKE